jgi:hypothetical protein
LPPLRQSQRSNQPSAKTSSPTPDTASINRNPL